MSEDFSKYLNNGTPRIIELLSSSSIEEDVRKEMIASFVGRIRDYIEAGTLLGDSCCLIDTVYVRAVDRRISDLLNMPKISSVQCDKGIDLCDELAGLVDKFRKNHWEIPTLRNSDIDKSKEVFCEKKDGISIVERIVENDNNITDLIKQAKSEYSVSLCDSVIVRLAELRKQISVCKNSRLPVPSLTNADIEKKISDIHEVRASSVKRSERIRELYERDMKIDTMCGDGILLVQENWEKIVSLCQEQTQLFKMFKSKKWPLPALKITSPEDLEVQISLYQKLINLDDVISSTANDPLDNERYTLFRDSCSEQKKNFETCKNCGWELPKLNNIDLGEAIKRAEDYRQKEEERIAVKRTFRIIIASAIAVSVLTVFCVIMYYIGKVRIPFNSKDVVGEDVEKVIDELCDAGFENIERIEYTGGWGRSDDVISVEIDGASYYSKGKYKSSDVSVVITYYSGERVDAKSLFDGWRNKEASNLYALLRERGFTNVVENETNTEDIGKDGKISVIQLYGNAYEDGECFLPMDAPIEIDYYKYRIALFSDLNNLLGKDQKTVKEQFVNAGFTNVRVDETQGYQNWEAGGAVVSIVVDGDNDCKRGMMLDPDVPVRIYYNSYFRIDISSILVDYETKTSDDVAGQLEKKGITDVELVSVSTNDKTENGHVKWVEIFGKRYTSGDCHVEASTKIKIAYGYLNIIMDQDSKYYLDDDDILYQDVKKEFEEKGFSNITLKRSDDMDFVNDLLFHDEGTIKSIVIGNSSSFEKGASFGYDSPVVIVVYTYEGKGCDDIVLKE